MLLSVIFAGFGNLKVALHNGLANPILRTTILPKKGVLLKGKFRFALVTISVSSTIPGYLNFLFLFTWAIVELHESHHTISGEFGKT